MTVLYCLSIGFLSACSAEDETHASADISTEENLRVETYRANPPYFPLANGCALPDMSVEMEKLQTDLMQRLESGFPIAEINPTLIQQGIVPVMRCSPHGAVTGETLKLYLVDHNLMEVTEHDCEGGKAYRGRVSTLNPTVEYGVMPKIQCAAMQLVMIGEYDVEICVQQDRIDSVDIIPRAIDPATPGFTVETLQTACSADE